MQKYQKLYGDESITVESYLADPDWQSEVVEMYVDKIGSDVGMLIDYQEEILSKWAVPTWPALLLVDGDGVVLETMLLSWTSGRTGPAFQDPVVALQSALVRLNPE